MPRYKGLEEGQAQRERNGDPQGREASAKGKEQWKDRCRDRARCPDGCSAGTSSPSGPDRKAPEGGEEGQYSLVCEREAGEEGSEVAEELILAKGILILAPVDGGAPAAALVPLLPGKEDGPLPAPHARFIAVNLRRFSIR